MLHRQRDRMLKDMRTHGFYYRGKRRHDPTAWDIDNGACEDFATSVLRQLPGGLHETDGVNIEWLEDDSRYATLSHCVLRFEGRYYDAEVPDGVDRLDEIPVITQRPRPGAERRRAPARIPAWCGRPR